MLLANALCVLGIVKHTVLVQGWYLYYYYTSFKIVPAILLRSDKRSSSTFWFLIANWLNKSGIAALRNNQEQRALASFLHWSSFLLESGWVVEQEEYAQLLTVTVSTNETSDKSASDLVLFPFASSPPISIWDIHTVCTPDCAVGSAVTPLSLTVMGEASAAKTNSQSRTFAQKQPDD